MLLKRTSCALLIFLSFAVSCAFAGEKRWEEVVHEIDGVLQKGAAAYAEGRIDDAKASVSDAYFNSFEGSGMETAIGAYISADRKTELESMFGGIRGTISRGAPASEVKEKVDNLVRELQEDAGKLDKGAGKKDGKESPYAIFLNSFIILLREGFEAILVISALTAYLAKAGHKDKVKTVYRGASLAVIASILTAILLQTAIRISGAGREALEGITMLFATAVLFYVSYWLITKMEVARWQHYIKSKIENSLTRGNVLALGFASFLAVYREGAETILFYQALYSASDGNTSALVSGLAAASLLLIGIFIIIKYGSVRIPIGPFFAVTSTLLYYLAFTFAGKGILELQQAEWVSSTSIDGFPTIGFLGIYPTLEGVLIQGFLVLTLMIAIVYSFVLRPYREKKAATKDISHMGSDISSIHEILDDVSRHAMICHGLSAGIAGHETDEMRKHLVEIDKKVHEVMGHLTGLEKGMEDIFSELEKDIER